MKITCQGCRDSFDIPDGKGITRAVCPFCDKPNDLRQTSAPGSSAQYTAPASYPDQPGPVAVKAKPHPLAPQFWILAICAMILTIHTLVGTVVKMIERYETAKAMEAIDSALQESSQKATEAAKQAEKAAADLLNKIQKALVAPQRPPQPSHKP